MNRQHRTVIGLSIVALAGALLAPASRAALPDGQKVVYTYTSGNLNLLREPGASPELTELSSPVRFVMKLTFDDYIVPGQQMNYVLSADQLNNDPKSDVRILGGEFSEFGPIDSWTNRVVPFPNNVGDYWMNVMLRTDSQGAVTEWSVSYNEVAWLLVDGQGPTEELGLRHWQSQSALSSQDTVEEELGLFGGQGVLRQYFSVQPGGGWTVTAVPEPNGWMLGIAGALAVFGVMGSARRRG